jgi:hypothetical protein
MLRIPDREAIVSNAIAQIHRKKLLLSLIYIPILMGLTTLVIVHLLTGIPLRWFFIDPVAEFNAPMYIGLVSNFGVLLWCAAASVCLFGGWLALIRTGHRESALFLICAGLVSSLLMLDDLYLLHEEVLPDHLFIPQKLVFAGYGCLILTFLFRFRQIILTTDFMLLFIAFGFFAISVFVDLFVTPEEFFIFGSLPGRDLIEDGFKFLGIVTWALYFISTCRQQVAPLLATV